jgi:hypothetical protein
MPPDVNRMARYRRSTPAHDFRYVPASLSWVDFNSAFISGSRRAGAPDTNGPHLEPETSKGDGPDLGGCRDRDDAPVTTLGRNTSFQ